MDLLGMDERQRLAWLMANRGTLLAMGAVWIGMIAWSLIQGDVPAFMLAMAPAFVLVRQLLYHYYSGRPLVEEGVERRRKGYALYGKSLAGAALAAATVLPIYSTESPAGPGKEMAFSWDVIADDASWVLLLGFAYLWPVLAAALFRLKLRPGGTALLQLLEPVFAAASTVIVLGLTRLLTAWAVILPFCPVPLEARAELGAYFVVGGNALYLVSWLGEHLGPAGVQR